MGGTHPGGVRSAAGQLRGQAAGAGPGGGRGHPSARLEDDFVAFYDFPQEHWPHLRTTNAIESVFAGVRLHADVGKRMRKQENGVYLVFKVADRLGENWRALNGGRTVMKLVLDGHRFVDGILQPPKAEAA